jgi:hypothetical protein
MILFHAFKHHLITVQDWLQTYSGKWNKDLQRMLLSIGSSQLDFYTGNLSVNEIKLFVTEYLRLKNIDDIEAYRNWIYEEADYRLITLPDNSGWTLRFLAGESFVHLHPSRYSLHTMRIKANVLKTCICALIFTNRHQINNAILNYYRQKYLLLPPMNEKIVHSEVEKVLALLA